MRPTSTSTPGTPAPEPDESRSSAVERILSRAGTAISEQSPGWRSGSGRTDRADSIDHDRDGDQSDLADRQALRRVAGLSTELADVTEVEYRQLRLERVVLALSY